MIKTLAPTANSTTFKSWLYSTCIYVSPIIFFQFYQIINIIGGGGGLLVHLEAIVVKKEIMVLRAPFAAFINAQEDELMSYTPVGWG